MQRILYVDLSPSPGGSVISLYHLASCLDRARFDPMIVLSTVNRFERFAELGLPVARVRTPQWEERGADLVDRVRAGRLGQEMRRSPRRALLWHSLGDARRLWRHVLPVVPPLRRIVRQFRPDLIHLNDAPPLVRHGILAGRLASTTTICHCRSFVLPSLLDKRLLLPGLAGLIFISQAVADAQLAAIRRPPQHRVIPNALNAADYAVAVDRDAVRASLGAPADAPLVGMVGRIAPWKGQHIFVEALAQVSQEHPTVHGVVVGLAEEAEGAGYADQVRQLAGRLGLGQRLHITGFRDDVPQVLAALDVLAHCSVRPEPFGRVIIEGMAAGRPVVGSRAGGALEIIRDGVDGLLVAPGDAAALAAALASLLGDPAQRERLGAAARRTASERYDLPAHVAAVQSFYAELLNGHA